MNLVKQQHRNQGIDSFLRRGHFALRGEWLWGAILAAVIVLAYQPAWYAGFLWDDDIYITANTALNGWSGLLRIWTTEAADISPLTTTTFWLVHAIWGDLPLPYHLLNVLVHAACACALWRVLLLMRVTGAWFGAALWALHPVQVESVAWAAELKNPESGLFFLLAILFFIRSLRPVRPGERAGWNYALALLFAALAMACKSSTVILPVVLCLCAWWLEGKWQWATLLKAAPFAVLSILAAISSMSFEKAQIAILVDPQWVRTWPERFITAGDATWFYLGKLLWPHPLMTVYPRWDISPASWLAYLPVIAVPVVLLVLWALRRTPARPLFFVFAYFVVALLPALGFIENTIFRYSLVFDHFQYLASMGPLALAGAGLARIAPMGFSNNRTLLHGSAVVLLGLLGGMSWQRAWVYENKETFWTDAVTKNPACWVGYNQLGVVALYAGHPDEAISQFRMALKWNPRYSEAYLTLGDACLAKGELDAAILNYRKSAELNPEFDLSYSNIGHVLFLQGKTDEALPISWKALQLGPGRGVSHDRYGDELVVKGQIDQATVEYQRALSIEPRDEIAHMALGGIYANSGRWDEAIVEFSAEAQLNPHRADALGNLGNALLQKGRPEEAIVQYEKLLKIEPGNVAAHTNLGAAHFRMGHGDEAQAQFETVIAINPQSDLAHYCLGLVYARRGQANEARAEYRKALAINPNNALARAKLGEAVSAPVSGH